MKKQKSISILFLFLILLLIGGLIIFIQNKGLNKSINLAKNSRTERADMKNEKFVKETLSNMQSLKKDYSWSGEQVGNNTYFVGYSYDKDDYIKDDGNEYLLVAYEVDTKKEKVTSIWDNEKLEAKYIDKLMLIEPTQDRMKYKKTAINIVKNAKTTFPNMTNEEAVNEIIDSTTGIKTTYGWFADYIEKDIFYVSYVFDTEDKILNNENDLISNSYEVNIKTKKVKDVLGDEKLEEKYIKLGLLYEDGYAQKHINQSIKIAKNSKSHDKNKTNNIYINEKSKSDKDLKKIYGWDSDYVEELDTYFVYVEADYDDSTYNGNEYLFEIYEVNLKNKSVKVIKEGSELEKKYIDLGYLQ